MTSKFPRTSCGKIGYPDKFTAEARAAWLQMTKPAKHPVPLRVYACTACGAWHLSSKYG